MRVLGVLFFLVCALYFWSSYRWNKKESALQDQIEIQQKTIKDLRTAELKAVPTRVPSPSPRVEIQNGDEIRTRESAPVRAPSIEEDSQEEVLAKLDAEIDAQEARVQKLRNDLGLLQERRTIVEGEEFVLRERRRMEGVNEEQAITSRIEGARSRIRELQESIPKLGQLAPGVEATIQLPEVRQEIEGLQRSITQWEQERLAAQRKRMATTESVQPETTKAREEVNQAALFLQGQIDAETERLQELQSQRLWIEGRPAE